MDPSSPIARTARLQLRCLAADDVDAMFAVYGNPLAARWVGDGQPLPRAECARWVDVTHRNYARRGYGMFALDRLDGERAVGFCGLVHPGDQPEAEIKYALRQDQWGQGLATEAASALLAWGAAQCGLRRVIATAHPAERSLAPRVAEGRTAARGAAPQRRWQPHAAVRVDGTGGTRGTPGTPGTPGTHGMRHLACALLALLSLAQAPAAAADEALARRARACTGCHGEQGRAAADGYYPRIAGKPAAYLHEQLLAFRDGRRRYALMTHLLEPLSDDYLRELAGYFAALDLPYPPPAPASPADAPLQARARQLVTQGDAARRLPACAACHGAALTGVLPAVPSLLGLPRDYLNAQLGAWRSGTRSARSPDCMADIARRLAPEDIAALSAWLSSQPVTGGAAAALPRAMPERCGGEGARVQP